METKIKTISPDSREIHPVLFDNLVKLREVYRAIEAYIDPKEDLQLFDEFEAAMQRGAGILCQMAEEEIRCRVFFENK